jgi:hypothetical protein
MEGISSQEQIRNRLCKSIWRHKNSAGFCWTRIDSSCNRRRISISLEAWWAVGNLGRDVGYGIDCPPPIETGRRFREGLWVESPQPYSDVSVGVRTECPSSNLFL